MRRLKDCSCKSGSIQVWKLPSPYCYTIKLWLHFKILKVDLDKLCYLCGCGVTWGSNLINLCSKIMQSPFYQNDNTSFNQGLQGSWMYWISAEPNWLRWLRWAALGLRISNSSVTFFCPLLPTVAPSTEAPRLQASLKSPDQDWPLSDKAFDTH